MYALIRPLLFRLDAEQAHALTLRALQLAGAVPAACMALGADRGLEWLEDKLSPV